MNKVCKKCNIEKNIEDFYVHKGMKDNHLNICIACVKDRVKNHRENNWEKVSSYDRKRNKLPARRKHSSAISKRWRKENPLAYKAQTAVSNALRDGNISKKPCRFCGSVRNIHAHHNDYVNFLNVVWLCARCHHRMHKAIPKSEGDNKSK